MFKNSQFVGEQFGEQLEAEKSAYQIETFSVGTAVIFAKDEPTLTVTFIRLKIRAVEAGCNLLTWNTADEKDFRHFEVERSIDAARFYKLGSVDISHSGNYQFIHQSHAKE